MQCNITRRRVFSALPSLALCTGKWCARAGRRAGAQHLGILLGRALAAVPHFLGILRLLSPTRDALRRQGSTREVRHWQPEASVVAVMLNDVPRQHEL